MGTQVAINHRTAYEYDRLVTLSPHVIRLRPAPHCRTPVTRYSLRVDPPDHFLNWQQDPHGNHLARAVFRTPARRLRVEVDLVAELTAMNPFDFFIEPSAETFPFEYEPRLAKDLRPYLETEPPGPELRGFLAAADTRARPTVDFLVTLNGDLERRIDYETRMEPGIRTCDETLARGRGSCRDSAWLLAQILRNLGLAARFVSGYLIQLVPDVRPLEGPPGPPRDSAELHAWVETYLPGAGWVGLDPTSGLLAAEGHLPVAATAEPATAAPITGSVSPAEVEFDHAVTVARLGGASPEAKP
jgi:transglutaminase-like putative cysteine protease